MKQAKEKAPRTAATMQSAKNKTQYQSTADQAVCQAPEIPGCQFVGYIANKQTGGKLVPLYEPKQPTNAEIQAELDWEIAYAKRTIAQWEAGERP